jgi:ubiquinone/menaquinone biosynthesis C-methylase UbiE
VAVRAEWDRFFDERYFTKWFPRDDPAQTEREARGAMALSGSNTGSRVLDAACGFGRHAIALSGLGYEVTGADRSPTLIAHARDLSEDLDSPPSWVQADYQTLPFQDHCFDVVISLNSSLGFDEGAADLQALTEFSRVLRPGGHLIIETNHQQLLTSGFSDRAEEAYGDGDTLIIEAEYDAATGIIRVRHTLESDGKTETLDMSRRIYRPDELGAMLLQVGFSETRRFGSLDGDPFTPETRLVIVAEK